MQGVSSHIEQANTRMPVGSICLREVEPCVSIWNDGMHHVGPDMRSGNLALPPGNCVLPPDNITFGFGVLHLESEVFNPLSDRP